MPVEFILLNASKSVSDLTLVAWVLAAATTVQVLKDINRGEYSWPKAQMAEALDMLGWLSWLAGMALGASASAMVILMN